MATAATLRSPRPREVSASGLLRAARELLADDTGWVRGDGRAALALTADGRRVPSGDPRAVRRCPLSALQAAGWGHRADEGTRVGAIDGLVEALAAVREVTGGVGLREAGTRLNHGQALDLLDRAAERAGAPVFHVSRGVDTE
jgi:hypothetical protein